jgi:hypothetical protein
MDLSWQQDSINPFLTTSNSDGASNKNIPTKRLQGYSLNPDRPTENPLKIDSEICYDNLNLSSSMTNLNSVSSFKPLPLPDAYFGFDPSTTENFSFQNPMQFQLSNPTTLMSNSNSVSNIINLQNQNMPFNIENFFKPDDQENQIDNDFLDANLQIPSSTKDEDLEKVLLDLGISEIPQNDAEFQQQQQPLNNNKCHKRQLSGSEIFGFVGVGDDSQLILPGMETVIFSNKKPLYKDITNFENIDFLANKLQSEEYNGSNRTSYNNNNNNNIIINDDNFVQNTEKTNTLNSNNLLTNQLISTIPNKQNNQIQQKKEVPDYYISSGNPKSYKFPPSPPKGSFQSNSNSNIDCKENVYSDQNIQQNYPKNQDSKFPSSFNNLNSNNQINNGLGSSVNSNSLFNSPEKSNLPTPLPTSPLNSIAMSSPNKQIFQTPKQSPRKILIQTQLGSQSKFKVIKTKVDSDDTTVLDEDNDKTISAITTPLKKDPYSNDIFLTPSKKRNPFNYNNGYFDSSGGSPNKNSIIKQKMMRYARRPTVRKKPTITSTLAAGTLDQYFEGPNSEGKFVCKFYDEDIQCICNRVFGRISNTRAHIQTHLSDRPFVCQDCGKSFVRNHDLKRHQKGHTTAENICPCGKTFPRADALKRHRSRNICVGGIKKKDGITKPTVKKPSMLSTTLTARTVTTPVDNLSSPSPTYASLNTNNKFDGHKNTQNISSSQHQPSELQQFTLLTESMPRTPSRTQNRPLLPNQPTTFSLNEDDKNIDIFDFNEIVGVDNNFSFNMDDSLVI